MALVMSCDRCGVTIAESNTKAGRHRWSKAKAADTKGDIVVDLCEVCAPIVRADILVMFAIWGHNSKGGK